MDSKIDALKIELATARANLKAAEEANELAECMLRDALPESKDASDYRIVVSNDDSWAWSSSAEMLDDVFGDWWCECEDSADHVSSKFGKCEPSPEAQRFIDEFEGKGRYGVCAHYARLEAMDAVTGEYVEQDACGGFFSYDGCAPEDAIRETLEPSDVLGTVEIIEEI